MNKSERIEIAFEYASRYGWGRQDAIGVNDTDAVIMWAAAWRLLTEAFETERSTHMPTMKDAYNRWAADGRLSYTTAGYEWWIIPNPGGTWTREARAVPVPNVKAY